MKINRVLIDDPLYQPSATEDHGLNTIADTDLVIYCPGISTGGFTEITLALNNPHRQVIATTIDPVGLQGTTELVKKYGVDKQITLKLEDVSQPLPYAAETFDVIYARLVLHYLTKPGLEHALRELYRILKKGGKFFLVMRDFDWESEAEGTTTDPQTGLTTYPFFDEKGNIKEWLTRYLQTEETLLARLQPVGFKVEYSKIVEETIYSGYFRTKSYSKPSKLIEILALK